MLLFLLFFILPFFSFYFTSTDSVRGDALKELLRYFFCSLFDLNFFFTIRYSIYSMFYICKCEHHFFLIAQLSFTFLKNTKQKICCCSRCHRRCQTSLLPPLLSLLLKQTDGLQTLKLHFNINQFKSVFWVYKNNFFFCVNSLTKKNIFFHYILLILSALFLLRI